MNPPQPPQSPQPPQRDVVRLSTDGLDALLGALGPQRNPGWLHDLDGNLLVQHGQPVPECERLLRSVGEAQAEGTLQRLDARGACLETTLQLSLHGAAWATQERPGVVQLRGGPLSAVFPLLLDRLRLHSRPEPSPLDVEPVTIPYDLLDRMEQLLHGPQPPARARAELADLLADVAPAAAEHVASGRVEVVRVATGWRDAVGASGRELRWLDTPAGLLRSWTNRSPLVPQRRIAPVSAWDLWVEVVEALPRPEDLEVWRES